VRAVDLTHAACTEGREKFVDAKAGAGLEGRVRIIPVRFTAGIGRRRIRDR
jgi:hypothetical protein